MDPDANPLNELPPVVTMLALALVGVEAVLSLADRALVGGALGVGWRLSAIDDYGVHDVLVERAWIAGWDTETALRLVTYPFVHLSFIEALFAIVLTLALGKFVGEVFRPLALIAVWLAAGIGGALVWSVLADSGVPLFGAYPPVYGLIGAFTYMLWSGMTGLGAHRLRAFSLIGMLLAIQLLFGLLFGAGAGWVAEVAGFAIGFGLSVLVVPGGWQALMARMRAR